MLKIISFALTIVAIMAAVGCAFTKLTYEGFKPRSYKERMRQNQLDRIESNQEKILNNQS